MKKTVNESYLRDTMFAAFNTLNEVSGIGYLVGDDERHSGNVAYPNEPFREPNLDDAPHCWFELAVLLGEPESVGLFAESQNRWSGFLQIDVHTPLDAGTGQADTIYCWLNEIFRKGNEYGECSVNGIYKASEEAEKNSYRTVFRVEFDADID